jgi:hypothetical protein
MLPFQNSLTGEDPLAKAEQLLSLRSCWYCQFFLIVSNLAGVLPVYVLLKMGFSMFSISVLVAVVNSLGYHLCQTTGYCFLSNLLTWTILDHISAPAMLAMVVIFTVNTRSVSMIRATHRVLLKKLLAGGTQTYTKLNSHRDDYAGIEDVRVDMNKESNNYYYSHLYIEENSVYDAWSGAIIYCYIFVAVQATLNHPFSMQAFIIVIAFGLGVVFFKIIVIDGGDISDVVERVSVPELVTGVVLIALSLVCFVLDGIFPDWYWWLHSLWHTLSFIGVYFYALGLTKNIPYWYSPFQKAKRSVAPLLRTHARVRNFKK